MREEMVDIWSYQGQAVIAITTNGSLTGDGRAIMGKGVARQAAERFPELRHQLGRLLQVRGNHVHEILLGLVSFPVEETPYSLPQLSLIKRSAKELRLLTDQYGWTAVVVPRPGCGGGGMRWQEVKPVLEEYFDDRFIVVSAQEQEK